MNKNQKSPAAVDPLWRVKGVGCRGKQNIGITEVWMFEWLTERRFQASINSIIQPPSTFDLKK